MLGTFLDKVSGLFDRRFIIAYWSPLFIGFGLAGGLVIVALGLPAVFGYWVKLSLEETVVLGVGSLLTITLLAYVLDALTTPLVRFYEGYWPWKRLTRLITTWQKKQKVQAASAKPYSVPRNQALLKPTRLGNVLAAAEEHSYQLYRLDAVIWWPRIVTLLPEGLRSQLDTTLTPMLALLNLSMILTLLAVGGGASLLFADKHWWAGVSVFIGGLVLARASYVAAVNQAVDYGQFVRVAFDMYRQDILKQIHVSVPDNLVEERLLWDALNAMVNYYVLPWETKVAVQTPQLASPFYYDTHQTSPTPTQQQEMP